MSNLVPVIILDLRNTKCPLNFVKAKLALEKLQSGDILEVWISATGESAISIPSSLAQEGHSILVPAPVQKYSESSETQTLWIRKA